MTDTNYEEIKYNGELYLFPSFNGYLKKSKDISYFYSTEKDSEIGHTKLESIWYDDEKDIVGIKVGVVLPFSTIANEFKLEINSFDLVLNNYTVALKPDNLMYAYDVASWEVWFEVKDQKLLDLLKSGNDLLRFTAKFNVELSTINERDWYAHE